MILMIDLRSKTNQTYTIHPYTRKRNILSVQSSKTNLKFGYVKRGSFEMEKARIIMLIVVYVCLAKSLFRHHNPVSSF